ncbi:hypothetical protein [Mycobacterium sp. 852002-30065_SCH5024008]|nr:hypothetical protein [Mycobacterium sp. 852002-30065_SCH5024008]
MGSEMCIRDRPPPPPLVWAPQAPEPEPWQPPPQEESPPLPPLPAS